jgi:hypothetical protein
MFRHETVAGRQLSAPPVWPAATSLSRGTARFAIVMFVHPDCPCSRASLAELEKIAAGSRKNHSITIVFSSAGGALWAQAGRLVGATLVVDASGREANRFGAMTSGHVVVYERGTLRYAGGVTGSRGHAGVNGGRRAVQRILAAESDDSVYPVFGCALAEAAR